MRGAGRVVFAAILLLMVGTLNVIYGIGAIDNANYFANDTRFVLDDLNTLGWVVLILGVIQLIAGFSLMAGNAFGRIIAIFAGSVGAIGALLSVGGATPGGRSPLSPSACSSCKASSSTARTKRPRAAEDLRERPGHGLGRSPSPP